MLACGDDTMTGVDERSLALLLRFIDDKGPRFHTAFGIESYFNRATMAYQYDSEDIRYASDVARGFVVLR